MFSRRSFFGLLAAAPAVAVAAPAIAKALPKADPFAFPFNPFTAADEKEAHRLKYELTTGRGWFKFEPWPTRLSATAEKRVIFRAGRLLGLIDFDEYLSAEEYAAGKIALDALLDDWYAKRYECPTERETTYALAQELAPEYGLSPPPRPSPYSAAIKYSRYSLK